MIIDGKPLPTFKRNARRGLIIQRHRPMLEAEVRRLRMWPEDEERGGSER